MEAHIFERGHAREGLAVVLGEIQSGGVFIVEGGLQV